MRQKLPLTYLKRHLLAEPDDNTDSTDSWPWRILNGIMVCFVGIVLTCIEFNQFHLPIVQVFFVEQETQLFVNIRLSGSGGSMWVTMKLAATWKYHLMIILHTYGMLQLCYTVLVVYCWWMLDHSGTGYFSRKGGLSHPGFGMQCVEGPFLKRQPHMAYDLGDFLGVAAQKAATKVIMVGWGHWIGCLYLLVALARPTPESGTEEAAMGCDSSANMRKQLTDQFPEICTEVSEVFVDVCRVCPRTVCSISSEKNHLCRNMATRIGGETTWLLGLYPAQRFLPVMFLQRVVIWDISDMWCVALKDWSESQSPLESCGQDLLLPCLQQDSRLGPSKSCLGVHSHKLFV